MDCVCGALVSVYCCNAVVERTLRRQLLIGSTLVSLLQKYMNLLVLLTVQMDQIFWIWAIVNFFALANVLLI